MDCVKEGITTNRPAPYPGPRCHTHDRLRKRQNSNARHEAHIKKMYGLTAKEYDMLYQFQGKVCAICQRATGSARRLAVDHDHATGAVRMLLCKRCNRMLGHLRDDPVAFERAAERLRNPPADQVFGVKRFVPVDGAPVKIKNYNPNGGLNG